MEQMGWVMVYRGADINAKDIKGTTATCLSFYFHHDDKIDIPPFLPTIILEYINKTITT